MNKYLTKQRILTVVVAIGVLLGAGFWWAHQGHEHENAGAYYTCAMHPQVNQAEPGNCPICGMRLIKKTRNPSTSPAAPASGQMTLTPNAQMLANVATSEVAERMLTKSLRTFGIVAFDRALYVAAQEYLSALSVAASGRRSGSRAIRGQGDDLLQAAREKVRLLGMSEAEIDELDRTRTIDRALYFPKAGDALWLNATIYESDRDFVQIGDHVRITIASSTDKAWQGDVVSVTPTVDMTTRTFTARIRITDNPQGLAPSMFTEATIARALGTHLAIPRSSVLHTGERTVVWVETSHGQYAPRIPTLGVVTEHFVQVVHGLTAGERVVSSGGFLVDSEAQLRSLGTPNDDGVMPPKHQHQH